MPLRHGCALLGGERPAHCTNRQLQGPGTNRRIIGPGRHAVEMTRSDSEEDVRRSPFDGHLPGDRAIRVTSSDDSFQRVAGILGWTFSVHLDRPLSLHLRSALSFHLGEMIVGDDRIVGKEQGEDGGDSEQLPAHPLDRIETGPFIGARADEGLNEHSRATSGHLGDEGLPISEVPIQGGPTDAEASGHRPHRSRRITGEHLKCPLDQSFPSKPAHSAHH